MPFIKKNQSQDSQPSSSFVGRTGEILFFVHNILQPQTPTHNIVSISGQGGVGKSTLLARFITLTHEAPFKDYCLTAIVDERQATPLRIMEKLAQQLRLTGKFEKALKRYKEVLRKQQAEQETLRETIFKGFPDVAGAVVEGIPMAGPLLREGTKVAATHFLKEHEVSQQQKDTELLEIAVDELTEAFVTELNSLADAKVTLSSTRKKRQRHIILFFDTFEQLAPETTPWLLDHFLAAQVSSTVILVVAGRDPVEHSSPNDPKRWLAYCDDGVIYWISLNSFTEDETRMYLVKRGITDADQIANIWHLSGGLPLYLGLLTSNPHGDIDPTKDVVVNFLRWIPEQESIKRRLALDAALLSRPFNQDDLEVFSYLSESDRTPLYQWLISQPFVRNRSQDGRYLYHDVARELFSRHLYQRSQNHYYESRRALATYYQELLDKIQMELGKEVSRSEDWLEVLLAVIFQWLSLPDQTSHIKAIEYILGANTSKEQDREIVRILRDLSQEYSPPYISSSTRWVAKQLLYYIQPDDLVQEVMAAGALLEKVADEPLFPVKLLRRVYIQRGHRYRFLGEEELALENFQQAINLLGPTDYSERGSIYRDAGNYQEALAHSNQALEQNPNDVVAYYQRGFTYAFMGKYQLGLADFAHALELDPKYTPAYNGRGWTSYYAGEYQRAVEAFEHLLELRPDHTAAIRGLGLTYCQLKEYQQALTLFDRRIELAPTYPNAFTDRSGCYQSLKEYRRSIEDCNRAIVLAPTYTQAYFDRGLASLWLKDLQQAQADLTRSYELKPTDTYSALMAEWTRLCQGAVNPNILERLEIIVAVDPQRHFPRICQGIALLLRRHFKEALAEMEQALTVYKKNFAAHFWKGMAYAFLGQDKEAVAAIEKALELELPPILLAPLRWFEQERPDFYGKCVVPLLAKYE